MKTNPKAFTNSPSSRSVSVRDIGRLFIPRTTTLRGDERGVNGFTLIELLVVVLIIGILAAVALPQYEKAVLKARYSNLKALTRSIADAQEIYYLANNTYATKFDELEVSLPEGKTSESTDNRYFYDWGDCRIIGSGYDSIECRNYLANMSYQIRLQYATYPRGTVCITYTRDLDDIRNQLCKAETQSTSYECCESSDIREWLYQ